MNTKINNNFISNQIIDFIKIKQIIMETHHFTFKIGNSLKEQTRNIPDGYGVYKIYANSKDGELLYIGKSGTIQCDGSCKSQNLRKRLNNKQRNMKRESFFIQKLNENPSIKELFIEYKIINEKKDLPSYYEAKLLQEYYQQHARLPRWNLCF